MTDCILEVINQLEHAGVYKCADEKEVSVYFAWLVYRPQGRAHFPGG